VAEAAEVVAANAAGDATTSQFQHFRIVRDCSLYFSARSKI
jgi:hypothetical protein